MLVHRVLRKPRRFVFAAAMLVVVACSESRTVGITSQVTVTVTATPAPALPGDTVHVTVLAVATGGADIGLIKLTSTGVLAVAESLQTTGGSTQSSTWSFVLPYQTGSVVFTGTAGSGSAGGTGKATVTVNDTQAPAISQTFASTVASSQGKVNVGTGILVGFRVDDNSGIARAVVSWTGAVSGRDSVAYAFPHSVTRAVTLAVPAATALNDSIKIAIQATDAGGNVANYAFPAIHTVDEVPPTVFYGLTGAAVVVPADTISISVSAHDAAGVRWLGYRLGPPANRSDSVSVSDTVALHTFKVTPGQSAVGTSTLTAFAVDRGGNQGVSGAGSLTVIDAVRLPTDTLHLSGAVSDVVFDATRNQLYLVQPSLQRVLTMKLAPVAFGAAIPAPSTPQDADLSVSGDTLVTTLVSTPFIALSDLTQTTPTMDTVRLGTISGGPDQVRVLANDKALVSITFAGSGYGGMVWEYDLAADTVRQRCDVGIYCAVTERTRLARSWDRKHMLLLIDDSCCPLEGFVYDAGSDSFSPGKGTISYYFPAVSADSTGSRYLMANELYDGSLNKLHTFTPAEAGYYAGSATAIAPNAQHVYMAMSYGYTKMQTSDGAQVARVLLPYQPSMIFVLPNEALLIALRDQTIAVVHLK